MIKRIAIAGFSLTLLANAAMAQSTPPTAAPEAPAQTAPATAPLPAATPDVPVTLADSNQCLKTASDLAQSAEDKKLGDDKLDKIDDLLTKMEVYCDAQKFAEAIAVAKDIKGVIDVN